MVVFRFIAVIYFTALLFTISSVNAQTAKLTPQLKPHFTQKEQPFAGSCGFIGTPGFARLCSIRVELIALIHLDSTQCFRLNGADTYTFVPIPDSLTWQGPIDSGSSFENIITFRPEQVGSYKLILGRRQGFGWQSLAALRLVVDEDRQTLFAGGAEEYQGTIVEPHPYRKSMPLLFSFPFSRGLTDKDHPHFTAQFKFLTSPIVGETTFVEFELECHESFYTDIYFVLEHTGNLKPSALPESWGNNAGPREEYRFYRGSFFFIPYTGGLGILDFKIIGKRPMLHRSNWATTSFPIYFVLGDANELLFAGNYDPWSVFKDPTDPTLGAISGLVEMGRPDYKLLHILSQPNNRALSNQKPPDSDSALNDSQK